MSPLGISSQMPNPSIVHPKRAERARTRSRWHVDSEQKKHSARLCAYVVEGPVHCRLSKEAMAARASSVPPLSTFQGCASWVSLENEVRKIEDCGLLVDNFKELSNTSQSE